MTLHEAIEGGRKLHADFAWTESSGDVPLTRVESLLSRVRRELHAVLGARLKSDEHLLHLQLTAAQLFILVTLATAEMVRSTDLCEHTSYDAGAMTRMLDRLESKGVVRRRRSPEDRRVVYLELTDEGRARLARMREISKEVFDRFLRGFSHAEVRRLEGYLTRLLRNARPPLGMT
ncbi:MAG TPA: MarR family transcriptional regulator [Steroidobacteraceae bacterium]|nr:MarR family transcriptional regulator [Steroidobacteraceae bacterium]